MPRYEIVNDATPDNVIMRVDSVELAQAECDALRVRSGYRDDFSAYEIVLQPARAWRVPIASTKWGVHVGGHDPVR